MEWIQNMDFSALLFIQEHLRSGFGNRFWYGITLLGERGWFWIALAVILLIPKKTRRTGILALLSMGLGAIITNVFLKNLFARVRPYDAYSALVMLAPKPGDFSFPSGHTCASFAEAVIYYKMLPKKYGIFFVILACMIGFSRLYLGAHYPTDVLGGAVVGTVSAFIILKLSQVQKKDPV